MRRNPRSCLYEKSNWMKKFIKRMYCKRSHKKWLWSPLHSAFCSLSLLMWTLRVGMPDHSVHGIGESSGLKLSRVSPRSPLLSSPLHLTGFEWSLGQVKKPDSVLTEPFVRTLYYRTLQPQRSLASWQSRPDFDSESLSISWSTWYHGSRLFAGQTAPKLHRSFSSLFTMCFRPKPA